MKDDGLSPLDRAIYDLTTMQCTLIDIGIWLREVYGRGHPLTGAQTRALTALNALRARLHRTARAEGIAAAVTPPPTGAIAVPSASSNGRPHFQADMPGDGA